jgi:hypothetical protein
LDAIPVHEDAWTPERNGWAFLKARKVRADPTPIDADKNNVSDRPHNDLKI